MLKKECCMKCWNKSDVLKNGEVVEFFGKGWTKPDEQCWESGYVRCPGMYLGERDSKAGEITERPPENCPYYLENIL